MTLLAVSLLVDIRVVDFTVVAVALVGVRLVGASTLCGACADVACLAEGAALRACLRVEAIAALLWSVHASIGALISFSARCAGRRALR